MQVQIGATSENPVIFEMESKMIQAANGVNQKIAQYMMAEFGAACAAKTSPMVFFPALLERSIKPETKLENGETTIGDRQAEIAALDGCTGRLLTKVANCSELVLRNFNPGTQQMLNFLGVATGSQANIPVFIQAHALEATKSLIASLREPYAANPDEGDALIDQIPEVKLENITRLS